jgi:hypothetical protein
MNNMRTRCRLALTILLVAMAGAAPAQEKPAPPATGAKTNLILDTSSLWRVRTIWEAPELILTNGETVHGAVQIRDPSWWYANKDFGRMPPLWPEKQGQVNYVVNIVTNVLRLPAETPADWMKPAYDDSGWARMRASVFVADPLFFSTRNEAWKAILLRGAFEVSDPATAGDLVVDLSFIGGAAVYLNGEEVARASMPAGALGVYTVAEPYPQDMQWDASGFAYFPRENGPDGKPVFTRRLRQLSECRIPAARLKKGVNIIAVQVNRAATPAVFYVSRPHACSQPHADCIWARVGLAQVRVAAVGGGSGITPNTGLVPGRGFSVWSQSVIQRAFVADYPDPFAALAPVRLIGVRGGAYAGQVVAGDDKPIKGISAVASDLKGPSTIPAAAIRVRYALPDGAGGGYFDSLEDVAPAEVAVSRSGSALQPIWVTVQVPPDARPGEYSGTVTVSAEGAKPVAVPVKLKLHGWKLPAYQDFSSRVDLIESPESVALGYNVPLWSDEHLKYLDQTFALLAPLSAKTLYITCIRRTHFGNEQAQLRWYRDANGDLAPDFTIVEKYLDVATRHLGKIPGVILYCWEPPESSGHGQEVGTPQRTYDKPILISVIDRKTGKIKARHGPAWGTPEAQQFWKRMSDGMQEILKKRGMEKSMLYGLLGDTRPTKQALDDLTFGSPVKKVAVHSHLFCDNWVGYESGFATALWGIGQIVNRMDPSVGRGYGWASSFWLAYFPRGEIRLYSTPVEYRSKVEGWMGAAPRDGNLRFGVMGIGRVCADFWPVVKDDRGRMIGNLAGYYPEASWGQLNLNNTATYVLGRGRNGPVPTVRSECLREGVQELEARIYLEKAWLDDNANALLGDDLRNRIRAVLDERIRASLYLEGEGEPCFISSDWVLRADKLYALATEVAARYNGQAPDPAILRPAPPAPAKK